MEKQRTKKKKKTELQLQRGRTKQQAVPTTPPHCPARAWESSYAADWWTWPCSSALTAELRRAVDDGETVLQRISCRKSCLPSFLFTFRRRYLDISVDWSFLRKFVRSVDTLPGFLMEKKLEDRGECYFARASVGCVGMVLCCVVSCRPVRLTQPRMPLVFRQLNPFEQFPIVNFQQKG
jgi:hypothetical protein